MHVRKDFIVMRSSREERTGAVVSVLVDMDMERPPRCLSEIKRVLTEALTQWSRESALGKQAFKNSTGGFNIGDLSEHVPWSEADPDELHRQNPILAQYLRNHGIISIGIDIISLDDPGKWDFDDVLIKPVRTTEEAPVP